MSQSIFFYPIYYWCRFLHWGLLSRASVKLKEVFTTTSKLEGNWSKNRLEAKALVCRTSYAGENEPKSILIKNNDNKKVTLCRNRAEANLSETDSCKYARMTKMCLYATFVRIN